MYYFIYKDVRRGWQMPWNTAFVTNQHSRILHCLKIWARNIKHNIFNFLKYHELGKKQKKNSNFLACLLCRWWACRTIRKEKRFCFLDNGIKWVPLDSFLKTWRSGIYVPETWNQWKHNWVKKGKLERKSPIIWLYDNSWTLSYLIVLCKCVERMVFFFFFFLKALVSACFLWEWAMAAGRESVPEQRTALTFM